jgi:hypothetical protein
MGLCGDSSSSGSSFEEQLNRLILHTDQSGIESYQRTIAVSTEFSDMEASLGYSKLFRSEGNYVILLAHCNPNGRPVQITGSWSYTSESNDKDDGNAAQDANPSRPLFQDNLNVQLDPNPLEPHFFQLVWPTSGTFDMSQLIFSTLADEDIETDRIENSVVRMAFSSLPNKGITPQDTYMHTPRRKIGCLALICAFHSLLILYSLRATNSSISIRNILKSQLDKSMTCTINKKII